MSEHKHRLRIQHRQIERAPAPTRERTPARLPANPMLALHAAVGNQAVQRQVRAGALPPGVIAGQQSALGNQAVLRLLRARSIQPKLMINEPGDQYEQEADQMADAVLGQSEPATAPGGTVAGPTNVEPQSDPSGMSVHGATLVPQATTHAVGIVQRSGDSALDQHTNEAERKSLQILTIEKVPAISPDELKGLFKTGDKVSAPVDDVKFGPGIDKKLEAGLKNVAGTIFQEEGFRFNSVTNLPLNLKPFGGVSGVYRFTLVDRKTKPKRQLIIEQVSSSPPSDSSKIDVAKHEKRMEKFGFKLGSGFGGNDIKKQLFAALARIPDPILERMRGVTFMRHEQHTGDSDEAGHYDPNTHTIKLFGSTLDKLMNSADALGADRFTYTIVHEVSHAVDYESYTKARERRDTLEKQLKEARKESKKVAIDPNAGLDAEKSMKDKDKQDQAKIKQLAKELEQAEKEFNKATEKLDPHKGGGHSQSKGFKDAKGKAISKYGGKANVENFAELLSIYILDPKLLKSLRPEAYEYFSKTFR